MIDYAVKKLSSIFNRSSRYHEVELKASITSNWLSSERDSMRTLALLFMVISVIYKYKNR